MLGVGQGARWWQEKDEWVNGIAGDLEKQKGSTPNAISLINERPGIATWYLLCSPHSGILATIYVIQ